MSKSTLAFCKGVAVVSGEGSVDIGTTYAPDSYLLTSLMQEHMAMVRLALLANVAMSPFSIVLYYRSRD